MGTQLIELDEMDAVRASVRQHYEERVRNAASCCGSGTDACCSDQSSPLYTRAELALVPEEAATVSYGCGNPTAIASLRPGEIVVDLGSGGGIDVFLAAQRVGPTGFVYGIDMTDEMLDLARRNAAKRGVANVEFRKGFIEAIPLPDASADVIISNCVVNLSPDKPGVLAEAFRVLKPGGRVAISDVVIDGDLSDLPVSEAQIRGALSWAGCVAGALTIRQYRQLLAETGFTDIDVTVARRYTLADLGEDSESGARLLPPAVAEQLVGRFTSSNISARRPLRVRIDAAQPADYLHMVKLLQDCQLPVEGLADHFATALTARDADADDLVVGSAALEVYGSSALLRSVAVRGSHRGHGIGERLVHEALRLARAIGVTRVFLLTLTAGKYFPRFGFQPVARAAIPEAVKQSIEFTTLCPDSALAMELNL